MNEHERNLLKALRENSRTSLLALAKQLGMPASTVHQKVQRYQKNVILKHTTLLDFGKLGYSRAYVAIKTTANGRQRVHEYLASHLGVNNLHTINSGYDFLVEFIGKDIKQLEDYLAALKLIPGVVETHKFNIIEDLGRETFHGWIK